MIKVSRLTCRMPRDIREWLDNRAVRNAASLNSEIVRVLREKMDQEDHPKT